MKLAIIGSRTIKSLDLSIYIPSGVTEIISGGAAGIDTLAREYARVNGLKLTEILPEYSRYGKAAPLKRNLDIIHRADSVLALWDGRSHGTKYVIDACRKEGVNITVREIKEL